jgi:hypothetical protein
MNLKCGNTQGEHEFVQVPLLFEGNAYQNAFGQKNNKTVAETLVHYRYAKLEMDILRKYPDALKKPLCSFLLELKKLGDGFYKRFLNKYGDLRYSIFKISDSEYLDCKGVYAYFAGQELKYIGRCKDSMKKRVNQGYGKIHPKNCYLDGQATNCHLNARITAEKSEVTLWLHKLDSVLEIEEIEKELIRACHPPWNIKRS